MKKWIAASAAALALLALQGAARAADVPGAAETAPAVEAPMAEPMPTLGDADGPCANIDKKCMVDLPNGVRMAYVETGPADGPAVILLHGLTDSARSWYPTMAVMHKANPFLRIIAPDQRGHGATSMPPGANCAANPKSCYNMAYFAADLAALMNKLNVKKATIAGHSMGSVVAQQMALDRPDRVVRIVLVATSNSTKDNAVVRDYVLKEPVLGSWKKALEARDMTKPEAIWNATPRDADPNAEAWMLKNWDVDPMADQAMIATIARETADVKMGTWIGATEALLEWDNTARLASLTTPTFVIWGTQDSIFFKAPDQDGIKAALATSKAPWFWKQYGSVALPASGYQESDIGHNVQWGAPREVAADILNFIRTGRPTSDHYVAVPLSSRQGFAIATETGKAIMEQGNQP